ncbi:Cut9-interacting protein scn1 [Cladophialophora carrionii]|uniref:Cut9-interacting protein scn1 n=1 Tax=Cladophialophora carrionii TaxID=86049 RepID=A0A1C1CY09_9EURO|nr:Cut9-interacting protein scn1 [Cladophialophora carrionii]
MAGNEHSVDAIWQVGVFDAHCHPTDILASIKDIANMKARVLAVMSTRLQDQHLVRQAAERYLLKGPHADFTEDSSRYVIPAFGWHPWFSHQLYNDLDEADVEPDQVQHYENVLTPRPDDVQFMQALPRPRSLCQFLQETEERLQDFPYALVGEVGLDRSFRLPAGPSAMTGDMKSKTGGSEKEYTPGTREGRPLSPYRVNIEHQKAILKAQFELAAKLRRPVSVHSVQAHGLVFEVMEALWKGHEKPSKAQRKKARVVAKTHPADEKSQASPFPPRLCMHSYSGPPDALKRFLAPSIPADIYFSFSMAINFSNTSTAKVTSVIKAVPDDRILVESDLHCAGERMDKLLEEIVLKVCEIKQWTAEDGARRLKANWMRFIFG